MAASEGRVAAGVLRRKTLTHAPPGVQYSRRRGRDGRRGDDRGGGQPQRPRQALAAMFLCSDR